MSLSQHFAPEDNLSARPRLSAATPSPTRPLPPLDSASTSRRATLPLARLSRVQRLAGLLLLLPLLLIAGLGWALTASAQRAADLEAEVLRLRGNSLQDAAAQAKLRDVVSTQVELLAEQTTALEAQEQSAEEIGLQINQLRSRISRLDEHNTRLWQALGKTAAPTAVPSPVVTTTPQSAVPLPRGGETHSVDAQALKLTLDAHNAELQRLSTLLGIYERGEADLVLRTGESQIIQELTRAQAYLDAAAPPPAAEELPEVEDPEIAAALTEQPQPEEASAPAPTPIPAPVAGKAPAKTASKAPSGLPYGGIITSDYGMRQSPFVKGKVGFHKGIDIAAKVGTRVRATGSGVVTLAKWTDTYGITVMIDHGDGWSTVYGHNSKLLVKTGQWVEKGGTVAYSGNTGPSTGPHIHYEVRRWGETRNPMDYR